MNEPATPDGPHGEGELTDAAFAEIAAELFRTYDAAETVEPTPIPGRGDS